MARSNVATAIRIALCGLTAPALAVAQEQPAPGSLEPAVQDETEEVVVQAKRYRPKDQTTATGLRLDLIDTPQSISVISEEMMDLAGVRSAYEAAEMVPGVNRQGSGFGSEFLIIRGQDAGDPRINGIDAYSASYLDAYATERLEIVRGPATVLYGVTASFGGEVNQVLKSPSANFSGNIGIEAGDFDRQRFEADVTGAIPGTDGRLKVRAAGAYTDAGMYQDLVQPTNNIDKLALLAATYDFTDSTSFTVHAYRQERDLDAFDGCTLVEDENNVLSIPRSIPFDRFYCNDPRQSQALVENNFAIASLSHQFANDWRIEAKVAKSSTDRDLNYVYGFGPAGADIEGSLYLSEGEIYFLSYAELTEDESFTSNLSLGGEFELAGRTHEFLAALEYQSSDLETTNFRRTAGATFARRSLIPNKAAEPSSPTARYLRPRLAMMNVGAIRRFGAGRDDGCVPAWHIAQARQSGFAVGGYPGSPGISGGKATQDEGRRSTGPARSCEQTRGLSDFALASGEGSGWHRPSGAITVGGLAVTAVPAPCEAGRKSRRHDPGSPQSRLP